VTARAVGTRLLRLAAAAAAAILASAAAAQQEDRAYDIPGRGTLTLSVPADWYDEPKAGPSGIPTIRFFDRVEAPRALDISVTVLWSPPGASPYVAKSQLRALVAKAAEDVVPGAAERELPLQELAVENGAGFYFEATAKSAQPGEPAYLTRGALAAGDVTITFTILAIERKSQGVAQAIEMLRTARREAAQ
jgi:hypothetical protein